jgi:hypothetical protein
VPGIEPGSIGGSAGLLRAYSRALFSAPVIPGTGHRQAQPRKFPSLTRSLIVRLSPLNDAAVQAGGAPGATRELRWNTYCWSSEKLDQAARAIEFRATEVWLAFVFLPCYWLTRSSRLPRPASPALTSSVETVHPRVVGTTHGSRPTLLGHLWRAQADEGDSRRAYVCSSQTTADVWATRLELPQG